MIPIDFTSEAKTDLFDAVEYYGNKDVDLGARMRDEITDILRVVSNSPYLWRERKGGYRRVNCPVFPYYVAYVIRDGVIVVVAIAASRKKPGYWHPRLN